MADRLEHEDAHFGKLLEVLHQERTSWRAIARTALVVLGWIALSLGVLTVALWVTAVLLGVIR